MKKYSVWFNPKVYQIKFKELHDSMMKGLIFRKENISMVTEEFFSDENGFYEEDIEKVKKLGNSSEGKNETVELDNGHIVVIYTGFDESLAKADVRGLELDESEENFPQLTREQVIELAKEFSQLSVEEGQNLLKSKGGYELNTGGGSLLYLFSIEPGVVVGVDRHNVVEYNNGGTPGDIVDIFYKVGTDSGGKELFDLTNFSGSEKDEWEETQEKLNNSRKWLRENYGNNLSGGAEWSGQGAWAVGNGLYIFQDDNDQFFLIRRFVKKDDSYHDEDFEGPKSDPRELNIDFYTKKLSEIQTDNYIPGKPKLDLLQKNASRIAGLTTDLYNEFVKEITIESGKSFMNFEPADLIEWGYLISNTLDKIQGK